MGTLDDKRFLFVTGKGGVGKSTVCAAQALALAQHGKRVLVVMCNAKERLSAMLGSQPVGPDVVSVSDNVWAVNIDPDQALDEFAVIVLKSRTIAKTIDSKYVRGFLRAVPGMHEWAMLGKAWWHTTELLPEGGHRYDCVILDAPATGHGLDMLRVPQVISEVAPPGLLRRFADDALALFRDTARSSVVLVTLPEEMPTQETIELAQALTGELKMPIGRVIINCVLPPLFSKEEREALGALSMTAGESPGEVAIASSRMRAMRERVQSESLVRLSRELPVAPSYLPLLFEDACQPRAIAELAKRLY
jgi:anion-transporting  ArsA/GET3 family ATPase